MLGGMPVARAQSFLVAPSDSVVFDCVALGEHPSSRIVITNRGTTEESLARIRFSDDYSAPFSFRPDQPQRELRKIIVGPDQSVTVPIWFLGSDVPGVFRSRLEFDGDGSEGGDAWKYQLDVRASVFPPSRVEVAPRDRNVRFDPVAAGDTARSSIRIANPGCRVVTITDVSLSDPQHFHVVTANIPGRRLAPSADPDKADSLELEIAFTATTPDDYQADLEISSDAGSGQPASVRLMATAVAPKLEIAPRPVDFGDVPVASVAVQPVVVRNPGTEAVAVTSMRILDGNDVERRDSVFRILGNHDSFTVPPGDSVVVVAAFLPKVARDEFATLVFETSGSSVERVASGLTGHGDDTVLRTPGFGRQIDFGIVHVDSQQIRRVTFDYGPDADGPTLHIDSLRVIGGDETAFAVEDRPVTLQPGESVAPAMSFSPNAVGPFHSMLRVYYHIADDPRTLFRPVALSGQGAEWSSHLIAQPSPVDFGSVLVGDTVEREVVVRNPEQEQEVVAGGADQPYVANGMFTVESSTPLPHVLYQNDAIVFRVRFAATSPGPAIDTLIIHVQGESERLAVALIADVGVDSISFSPTAIDVLTDGRNAVDTVMTLIAPDVYGARVQSIALGGPEAEAFEVVGIDRQPPFRMTPGETVKVTLRANPLPGRRAVAHLLVTTPTGRDESGDIAANWTMNAARHHVFSITDTTADLTLDQPARVYLVADPPLSASEHVSTLRATLEFDRTSLVEFEVAPTTDASVSTADNGGNRVVLTLERDDGIDGDTLAAIDFRGHIRSDPINLVDLLSVNLSPDAAATVDGTVPGRVIFDGCGIGVNSVANRPVRLYGVTAVATNRLRLDYTAPADGSAVVTLTNLAGAEVSRTALPPGTGSLQSIGFDTGTVAPGFYILSILSNTGIASTPISIE